jgi:hypothetical protein
MDSKITKQRLMGMLSYDWLKIIACILAACLVWSLAFTTSATKLTNTQEFYIYNYSCNEMISDTTRDFVDNAKDNVFSYEVIETQISDLRVTGNESTIFEAYFGVGMGDLLFAPHVDNPQKLADEESLTPYTKYTEIFFNAWCTRVQAVDEFVSDMRVYVQQYYDENGALNKAKVEEDFKKHIKDNNDKRFKREKAYQDGIEKEYERIEKYAKALVEFEGYLNQGLVEYVQLDAVEYDGVIYREKGNYALNLCPDVATMGELNDFFCYQVEETSTLTAKDMCVMFLDLPNTNQNYRYESLLFVNHLIKTAHTRTMEK